MTDKETRGFGRAVAGALIAATLAFGAAATAEAKSELLVYTALEDEQLPEFKTAFEAKNPDIEIKWVRDSTGPITSRLLAEKENRQADAVWGLAATSLMILDQQGMLEAYKPAGFDKLSAQFRDNRDNPTWTGMDAWASAICFNTAEGAKLGLKEPTSWADLLKPEYKGHIVMPNPASSGTGFLTVSAWLQMMGEEKGWAYMDKLHENINTYLHSGSKPCVQAGQGEYPVGISFAYRGVQEKNKGAPLDIIMPSEGIGWDMEATAIMKGTKNLDAAKKLADFAASEEANKNLYAKAYSVVAFPGAEQPIPNYPAGEVKLMIKNDFNWAAANRDKILEEWEKRYGSKDAPKT
jgi:iron(III) transport system substrate-binding protein